jgi:hypothetical protein
MENSDLPGGFDMYVCQSPIGPGRGLIHMNHPGVVKYA